MSNHNVLRIAAASAIALSLVAGGATAYADERPDARADEARIMSSTKVSMSEAIVAAEKATGGKAVGSGIEDQDGLVHFEVTILKDKARQKVLVDSQTGQIVKTVVADSDNEDEEN